MGIPSYFSYIIKNYSNIIRNLEQLSKSDEKFHSLYMDCNSIIYDSLRSLDTNISKNNIESTLIQSVTDKIGYYITLIAPTDTVFIAFDGVAPFAKMNQQRTRRYKGDVQKHIHDTIKLSTVVCDWSTSNITPGTNFMKQLSMKMRKAFKHLESHFHVKRIIVSGSDECGEGEHKLFKHIRDREWKQDENVVVYGLDSDLIMLSVFHCNLVNKLYVFRETPEFGKQLIPSDSQESPHLFMDIQHFSRAILNEMNCEHTSTHRLYDYIFLCFFLGNDFLPHFPSLNIRTTGIETLMECYRTHIGKFQGRYLISMDRQINWKWVSTFILNLAKSEHERILQEYVLREKWGKRKWKTDTPENRDTTVQSGPVLCRPEELYIDPKHSFWEKRYYMSLFHEHDPISDICINYLEGLEWVFKYYTHDCPHWRWRYKYHYPPLLVDLVKHVPTQDCNLININDTTNRPFKPHVQLAYVLPKSKHHLLPIKTRNKIASSFSQYYVDHFDFQWAFCRYFWEAHTLLPDIPLSILDQMEYTDRKEK